MPRITNLMLLLVLAAQVPLASATVTYVVGNCKPSFPAKDTFQHINDAVNATPPPSVIEVCPGTYAEVVGIFHPMTWKEFPTAFRIWSLSRCPREVFSSTGATTLATFWPRR